MSESETDITATSGYETASLMSSSDDDFPVYVDSCSDSADDWELIPQVQLPHNLPQGAVARARYQERFALLLDMDLWPSLREQGGAVGGREESQSGESTSGSSRFADTEDNESDEDEEKEEMQHDVKGPAATKGFLPPSLVVSCDDGYYLDSLPELGPMRYPVLYPDGKSADSFIVQCFPAPSMERSRALTQQRVTNVHKENNGCYNTSIPSFGTAAHVWCYTGPIMSSRKS